MKRAFRGAAIGLVSLVAMAVAAAPGAALEISPTGAYTLTSGPVTIGLDGTGLSLDCRSTATDMTLARDGSGTAAATFVECRHPMFGEFAIITTEWRAQVTLRSLGTGELRLGTLVGIELTVPRGGILIGNGVCVFSLSGVVKLGHEYRETTLPITASTTDDWTVLSTTLAVDAQRGCPFAVGTRASYGGPYNLSRGMAIGS